MDKITSIEEFNNMIEEAYRGRNRDVSEASSMLHIEAAELSELFLKRKWHGKNFEVGDLLSEAGDILNFLTFILQYHDLTLLDAMNNNKRKLKLRGYIK